MSLDVSNITKSLAAFLAANSDFAFALERRAVEIYGVNSRLKFDDEHLEFQNFTNYFYIRYYVLGKTTTPGNTCIPTVQVELTHKNSWNRLSKLKINIFSKDSNYVRYKKSFYRKVVDHELEKPLDKKFYKLLIEAIVLQLSTCVINSIDNLEEELIKGKELGDMQLSFPGAEVEQSYDGSWKIEYTEKNIILALDEKLNLMQIRFLDGFDVCPDAEFVDNLIIHLNNSNRGN